MIIAMPSDRERSLGGSYSLLSFKSSGALPENNERDTGVWPLTAWVILCHRYSQQLSLPMDCYPHFTKTHADALSISLELDGDEKAWEIEGRLKNLLLLSGESKERSNCAFFLLKSEEEKPLAWATVNGRGYELSLLFLKKKHEFSLEILYSESLHSEPSMARLMRCYERWLKEILDEPNLAIDDLELLTPAEVKSIEQIQTGSNIVYPQIPVYQIILNHGTNSPHSNAVSFVDHTITYGELSERSTAMAIHLQEKGVACGDVVAICTSPCIDFLVALLGLWQLGAIYCPLDPTHPEAYIQHMLDLADPKLILLPGTLAGKTCFLSRHCLIFDRLTFDAKTAQPFHRPSISLDQAAYLFFTSGTTGKPKGVLASHRNLAHYIHSAQQSFLFSNQDVFISIARYTFSISLFELISPLCAGGRLLLAERHDVLNPERLLQLLDTVTVLHAGPSLLTALFRYLRSNPSLAQELPQLRHVSSGGDVVTASTMEEMKRVFSQAEIFVLYGSTEISCMGTFHPVSRGQVQTRSLVGKSFPGVRLCVLDKNRRHLAFGIAGDIWFAGLGLAIGYYKQPELEEGKFHDINGERFYKMGDTGRLMTSGDLEMLGRNDYQIQLRGIRIELVGIENAIRELGLAQQCAVVHKKELEQEFLVFFLVGARATEIASFRKELAAHFPDYMLPQYIVVLEKMPLTVNGKLDRKALTEMPWQTETIERAVNRPNSLPGQQLATAFEQVLNRKDVGIDQSFFDLGGHSMLAILLLQELKDKLNIRVPPQVFFEYPTISGVLRYLDEESAPQLQPMRLNQEYDKPMLFMLAGVQTYRPLAKKLEGHFNAFSVFSLEELSATEATSETLAIDRLADHYLAQIQTVQPAGPYHLLGYSFAGIVAYELAQKLRARGEDVKLLVLIDAIIPEWGHKWSFRQRQLLRIFRRPPRDVLGFLFRRLREVFQTSFSELNQYKDDARLGLLYEERILMKSVAAHSYLDRRKAYPGPCLLIVSEDRLRRDPLKSRTCGWSEVAVQLEVHSVAGDHFKMVEQEPDVSEIAEIILKHYKA